MGSGLICEFERKMGQIRDELDLFKRLVRAYGDGRSDGYLKALNAMIAEQRARVAEMTAELGAILDERMLEGQRECEDRAVARAINGYEDE